MRRTNHEAMTSTRASALLLALAMLALPGLTSAQTPKTFACAGSECTVAIRDATNGQTPPISVTSTIDVPSGECPMVQDVNVTLVAEHNWVGDLSARLTHGTGAATVIDRPRLPGLPFGCLAPDLNVVLDDEASALVESQCGARIPAIGGTFRPNQPLSAFDGQPGDGSWLLTIDDNAADADEGHLVSWSMTMTCVPAVSTDRFPSLSLALAALALPAVLLLRRRRAATPLSATQLG